MSREFMKQPKQGGVCGQCKHDLYADKNTRGTVRCTNPHCRYHDKPYPLGSRVSDSSWMP